MKRAINGVIETASSREMGELPGGAGVFETLLLREGMPVFFEDHWARFVQGCRWCGLAVPTSPETMQRLAETLAEENGIATGVLRFVAWQKGKEREWRVEVSPPRPHMTRPDARIGLGPTVPAATLDRAFKHLNRVDWLQALRTARTAGWDDALLFDPAGSVVETCVSNVFFVDQEGLHTPGLEAGPLPGVMRGRVIALARELGLALKEGQFPLSRVERASEVWLSNSLLGLRPVRKLAGQTFSAPFPVLQRFRSAWEDRYGWDPVVIAPAPL